MRVDDLYPLLPVPRGKRIINRTIAVLLTLGVVWMIVRALEGMLE